jgi:hypothetical protein
VRSSTVLLAAFALSAATGAQAAVLRLTPAIQAAADGDRVVLRWEGVPDAAVEQEVLVSLDGGSRWIEVRRLEIEARELELRLPRGVAADVLFALRTGDEERELEEAVAAPVRLPTRAALAVPIVLPTALGRRGDRRTDGSGGGRELPPALEPCREDGLERLRKASADSAWLRPPSSSNGGGLDPVTQVPAGGAAPRSIPLRT